MGRRGPAKTPSAILRARGSWRGQINSQEPAPQVGAPDCPPWLTDAARGVWSQLVELIAPGVLSRDNGNALARYCDAFVRWKSAAAYLAKNGETYAIKNEAGKVKCVMPWPQVSIYATLSAQLSRLEAEFGLTPASRAAIVALPTQEPQQMPDADGPPILKIAL